MYRREKQRGTVRGKIIVLLHREFLGGRIFLTVGRPPGNKLLTKRHTNRRGKQRGTVRGKFIVLLHREILGGRIFLTVEAPPGKTLLKKRHEKYVQEGKTTRYCTRHVYRPLAPRNSGRTHFPYCRRASQQ